MKNTKTAFNENPHMNNAKKYLEKALEELLQEEEYQTRFLISSIEESILGIDDQIQTYLERCYQDGEVVQF